MISIACSLFACAIAIRAQTTTTTTGPIPTTVPTTASSITPNAFAPIAYFETNCARCHGPYGTAYGAEFGRHLSDEQLTKVVDDMAAGPGNAPVEADQLKILVDYHKAMIAKRPFVAVTKAALAGEKVSLEGEVTPDASVTVGEIVAKVDGATWSATVDKALVIAIVAKVGDASRTITVSP